MPGKNIFLNSLGVKDPFLRLSKKISKRIALMAPEKLWILLGKKKSGEASPEELAELESLLAACGDQGFAHEIVDKVWEKPLSTAPEMAMGAHVWNNISDGLQTSGRKHTLLLFRLRKPWVAAASVIILAGLAWWWMSADKSSEHPIVFSQPLKNNVITQPGSKTKIELPDGTQVWLNASSRLTYSNGNFGLQERDVTLTGEAFFDVVKNEKVPFIIHTRNITISVKGTAFNVKAYPGEKTVETALLRGLVEITTKQDPDRWILLKPNEKIIIPVQDSVAGKEPVRDASVYSITPLHQDKKKTVAETVWMQPRLEFDNESMEELAPRMENWFNIKIHFLDENIKSRRFSGIIEKESLQQTIDYLTLTYPFRYTVKANELWIGSK